MTLEQLLNCSASQLEAMSDEQLKQHFAPFFNVTRPELADIEKNKKPMSLSPQEREKQRKIDRGRMLVEQFMKKQGKLL